MVQPTTKRLVTEASFKDLLNADYVSRKRKDRLLGDQFCGVRPGSRVSSSKAVVSLGNNVLDGYIASPAGPTYMPNQMYDIADVNWVDSSLGMYGAAYLNYTKPHAIGTAFDFTTMFEGTYAVITTYKAGGVSQDLRIWIDDEEVTDWYLGDRATGVLHTGESLITGAIDGAQQFYNINFAKRGMYKIRCAGASITGTTSLLATNADGKFHKPAKQRTFGIISDSWYETITAHTSLNAGNELAARMGWRAWNLAVGGSGFMNPGVYGTMQYGSDAVFTKLLEAPPMDLLLLNGSVNDMTYPQVDVIAAMNAFFTRWRTVRPDTPIVWKGLEPQSYFENIYTAPVIIAREAALAAVALADPSVIGVIKPSAENWLTGTGNSTAPNGTGTQDWNTGSDGVHLTAVGQVMDSAVTYERLRTIPTWKVAA